MSHNNFDPYDPCSSSGPLDHHSSSLIHDHHDHFPPLRGMLNPLELTFGDIAINEASATQTVTLTNTGTRPLTIAEIRAVGPFTVSSDLSGDGVVLPGKQCLISVMFRPTQEGAQTGGVYVDTGNAAGTEFVALLGSGAGEGSGTGSGTPTGPAGGDLDGMYPNPVLRVQRATVGELAEGLSGKANVSHTHSLAQISQSGANIGDVAVWSGSNWVPGTADGTPSSGSNRAQYRIVVVTDSTGADQSLLEPGWPTQLQRLLRASGVDAEVYNLGINGMSYNIANTAAKFGATDTVRQRCIDLQPNIILTALGYNDSIRAVGSRSLIEMQNDALAFFTTIKAALPAVKIFYGSQVAYDNDHVVPASLLNKHVMPIDMQRRSTGVLAGCWCSEILDDAVASDVRTRHGNWLSLDSYIKSLPQVNGSFTVNMWKAARLGMIGYDGLHPTSAASKMFASAARQAFITVPAMALALPGMSNQATDLFNDPEVMFNSLVSNNGSDWANRVDLPQYTNHPVAQAGPWNSAMATSWYMPSKGSYRAAALTNVLGTPFTWMLTGCYPLAQIFASYDGTTWINSGGRTDGRGNFLGSGSLDGVVPAGDYTFRYRIGDEIHGPVSMSFVPGASTTNVVRAHAELRTRGTGTVAANAQSTVPLTNSGSTALGSATLESIGSGNYRIKVPRAGTHMINCSALITPDSAALGFIVIEVRNAAGTLLATYQGPTGYNTSAGFALGATFSRPLTLAAGDTITPKIWCSSAGTFTDGSQGGANFLSVTEYGANL